MRSLIIALLLLMFAPLTLSAAPEPELPPTFDQAVALYYRGEFEAAEDAFRHRLRFDSDDGASRGELVRLLRERGAHAEAFAIAAAAADPDRDELLELGVLAEISPPTGKESTDVDTRTRSFWLGLDAIRRGDSAAAAAVLRRAADLPVLGAVASLLRGEILLTIGEPAEAARELSRALAREPNLSSALLPLARARTAEGDPAEGYRLLARARRVLPGNREIEAEFRRLVGEHPELIPAPAQETERMTAFPPPPDVTRLPADRESLPILRIGLAEESRILHIKTGGKYRISTDGERIAAGERDELMTVRWSESGILMERSGSAEAPLSFTGPIELRYDSPASTTLVFGIEYGSGYYFAGSEDRRYRGGMRILHREEGLTLVNLVNLEEYLYGTVPSEIPAYWPKSALEAQAIAARSYSLANSGRFDDRGFDLYASVRSASYRGAGNEAAATNDAVDATRGVVLRAGDSVLNAVYSANSGGYTESSETVWGFASSLTAVAGPLQQERQQPLPPSRLASWIEAVPPSFSAVDGYHSSYAYRWSLLVSAADISARLDAAGMDVGPVRTILSRGRGVSGRVAAVEIIGESGSILISGDRIRSLLGGLRSTLFVSEPLPGSENRPLRFLFRGAGWGHGVGMDQSAAAGMAADGWSASMILAHFYPSARLEQF